MFGQFLHNFFFEYRVSVASIKKRTVDKKVYQQMILRKTENIHMLLNFFVHKHFLLFCFLTW